MGYKEWAQYNTEPNSKLFNIMFCLNLLGHYTTRAADKKQIYELFYRVRIILHLNILLRTNF